MERWRYICYLLTHHGITFLSRANSVCCYFPVAILNTVYRTQGHGPAIPKSQVQALPPCFVAFSACRLPDHPRPSQDSLAPPTQHPTRQREQHARAMPAISRHSYSAQRVLALAMTLPQRSQHAQPGSQDSPALSTQSTKTQSHQDAHRGTRQHPAPCHHRVVGVAFAPAPWHSRPHRCSGHLQTHST